jgi:hypothetical protein
MIKPTKKVGRPGRKITSDNYALVIEYFARDSFRASSAGSIGLKAFASQYKHTVSRFGTYDEIEHYLSTMENLLEHHIKNKSPYDMIQRFEERIAAGKIRVPITESMLNDLHIRVKVLPVAEWQRCSDWIKQKRKRAADKSTDAEKRTIKVSTSVFDQLNSLKSSLPDGTWDELFLNMVKQYKPRS